VRNPPDEADLDLRRLAPDAPPSDPPVGASRERT
jgi:hypothetical protein